MKHGTHIISMLACVLAVHLLAANQAAGQATARSIRHWGYHPEDMLDRPVRRYRSSHLGWEVRGPHFVVVSTTGPDQAEWVSDQLEDTWKDIGQLADHWSGAHRQDSFANASVGVLVSDKALHYDIGTGGPSKDNHGTDIIISLAAGEPSLPDQLPHMKQLAWDAFVRTTQMDQHMPDWVQAGIGNAVAGVDPRTVLDQTSSDRVILPSTGPSGRPARLAADQLQPLTPDEVQAALWVQYLLEADDGKYAGKLLDVMAGLLDATGDEILHVRAGGEPIQLRNDPMWADALSSQRLFGKDDAMDRLTQWLNQPDRGRPMIVADSTSDPQQAQAANDLVLAIKLAELMQGSTQPARQPLVMTFSQGQAHTQTTGADPTTAYDLNQLRRWLQSPAAGNWSIRDSAGDLVTWRDSDRIDRLVGPQGTVHHAYLRGGQSVLQCRTPGGKILEGWLERNPRNASRPIARIKTMR
jgi:hypothetical protein